MYFLIKKKDGTKIGGGVYPPRASSIELLNTSIKVSFKFLCNLADGYYFFNAGIEAQLGEKKGYAHRILDAYMIKVINQSSIMTSIVKIVEEAGYEEWK